MNDSCFCLCDSATSQLLEEICCRSGTDIRPQLGTVRSMTYLGMVIDGLILRKFIKSKTIQQFNIIDR